MKDTAHLKGFGRLATLLMAQHISASSSYWFAGFVEKLIKSRGHQGALLYLDALGEHVGVKSFGLKPQNPRPTWVRRSVVKFFLRSKNKHLLRRLTKIKRHITLATPTPKQVSKFLDSALRAQPCDVAIHEAKAHIERGIETMRQYFPKSRKLDPKVAFTAYVKRELSRGIAPALAFTRALEKIHNDIIAIDNLGYFNDKEVEDLFLTSLSPLSLSEFQRLRTVSPKAPVGPNVGTVHAVQEPGAKLRVFASPRLLIQCALEPLKVSLMDGLKHMSEDACFSQEDAVIKIQNWLLTGHRLSSYDLADATNMFPSVLSDHTIDRLLTRPTWGEKKLLRWVQEDVWAIEPELASHFGMSSIKWSVGQPLGTGPSFGAFSVAHHALVRGICIHLGANLDGYTILGDDIVIRDPVVAAKYRKIMTSLGVQISESKSIVSANQAEFAGCTITRTEAFRPGKWREVTAESLLTFCTDPGYDYKRVVPRFWVPLIERMKDNPYPYGLRILDLSSMTHQQVSEYADHVCYAFLKSLFLKESTGKPDENQGHTACESINWKGGNSYYFYSDVFLLRDFIRHSGLIDLIYTVHEEYNDNPRALRLIESERKSTEMRAKFAGSYVDRSIYEPDGVRSRLLWRWYSADCCIRMAKRPSRSQLDFLDTYVHDVRAERKVVEALKQLHPDEDDVLTTFLSLLNSVICSFSAESLNRFHVDQERMVYTWIDAVPILQRIYQTSTTEPTPLEMVKDLLGSFPFYGLEDFFGTPTRFASLLRRYARERDVMPSLRVPMPRLRRG